MRVLIRVARYRELVSYLNNAKNEVGLSDSDELHFRDLEQDQQDALVAKISQFKCGVIAIVSNKRNMRRYRNRRIESQFYEVDKRGKRKAQKINWFYNHTFRYLLERASEECAVWTDQLYGGPRRLRIILAQRKGFNYAQSRAYFEKIRVEKRDSGYFNNKRQVNWRVFESRAIEWARPKNEPGLQFADCVASAIHRAIDEDWYNEARPQYVEFLKDRFLKNMGSPRHCGFTLLPSGFRGPVSDVQRRALAAVDYTFTSPNNSAPRPPRAPPT